MSAETDDDPQAPTELVADLRRAFRAPESVPLAVDEAVLGAAPSRRPRTGTLLRFPRRWAWPSAAAAAALVLYLAGPGSRGPAPESDVSSLGTDAEAPPLAASDLDGNGAVDIIDAFRLALWIEDDPALDARYDLDGDGAVDRADVDEIVRLAVRLSRS